MSVEYRCCGGDVETGHEPGCMGGDPEPNLLAFSAGVVVFVLVVVYMILALQSGSLDLQYPPGERATIIDKQVITHWNSTIYMIVGRSDDDVVYVEYTYAASYYAAPEIGGSCIFQRSVNSRIGGNYELLECVAGGEQ